MTERFVPMQVQPVVHMPYSVDKNLRLRRLEHQLQVLADAVRVLASNADHTDRTLADAITKMLDEWDL
jgi:hypothetical protein